jgi:hypothetical protein
MNPAGNGLRSRLRDWLAIACMVGAALSLAVGPVVILTDLMRAKAGCDNNTIETTISPDNSATAVLKEEICSDGLFQTEVDDYVQVARPGVEPTRDDDVFAVDNNGGPKGYPALHWLSPRQLQITVPNKSLIGLQKANFQGIDIVVKFDPDDPVERERFLQQFRLGPK